MNLGTDYTDYTDFSYQMNNQLAIIVLLVIW